MKTETLKFDTANGATTAYVVVPEKSDAPYKTVILIHEWWGMNPHVKSVAERYAKEGFLAVAPDLFRGKTASTPPEASELMKALEIEDGVDTIKNVVAAAAKENYEISGFGITGFCMGGTFALRAACDLSDTFQACAPFYGDIPTEGVLQNLRTPTIFISGTKDQWITPERVAELERVAKEHNLPVESVAYEADHAFFNDTRPEVYDAAAASNAWSKVTELFNAKLGGA